MSLLTEARQYSSKIEFTQEEIEVSVAWAKGEITSAQAAVAMKKDSSKAVGTVYRMALILRKLYQEGKLK